MKLLIVDDNAFMRRLIKQIVGSYFSEIFETANGFEAVKCFKKHEPDWVIMDLEMPLVDGLAATKIIKKLYPSAKILIITKYDEAPFRSAADAVGATAFASKDNLLQIWTLMGGWNYLLMPENQDDSPKKIETITKKVMLETNTRKNSKQELLRAIQKTEGADSLRKTIKSPSQILQFIEEHNETIESLAKKTEVSEREILLAIRDSSDTATRKKIAEALQTTYYSIFGK